MAAYTVIIQPEAELDLDEIYDYLEQQKQGLGFDLLAGLTEILQLLEKNPLLFQKVFQDKRRAIVRRFQINIIYIVKDHMVYILAIIHSKRSPGRWQEERWYYIPFYH